MSDSADTTFKINDLLVSIVPATDTDMQPTQIVSGTIAAPILTNVAMYWPVGGGVLCGTEGRAADVAPGMGEPPLLAGVKALLRAQIAELEAQTDATASTALMPTTVEQATVLETKLSAALDAVRRAKVGLEANFTK